MLQEILKDLHKLTELRFTPSIHIVAEVEKLIEKIKSSMEAKEEEPALEEGDVTINGVAVSFEKHKESKKHKKEHRR